MVLMKLVYEISSPKSAFRSVFSLLTSAFWNRVKGIIECNGQRVPHSIDCKTVTSENP